MTSQSHKASRATRNPDDQETIMTTTAQTQHLEPGTRNPEPGTEPTMKPCQLATLFATLLVGALLLLGGRAEAATYTWDNDNVAGTPVSPLDWFTDGPNTQGAWIGGDPESDNANTVQFFENTTTALTNTAAATQTVNLNNIGGLAFELGTLTLSGLASATPNANLTMTLSGDPLNFSAATGTINLNALIATRTITYNVNNNIRLGTASSGSALTIGGNGTSTFVIGGAISELQAGGGSLVKSGSSTVSLDAANTYTGATTVSLGVLLLNNANALPGGVEATGGTSNLTFNVTGNTVNFPGVVGLTSNFTRSIGTSASQVQWTDGGGFAAFGADRTVNFGGNSTPSTIVWGNTSATGGFGGYELILGDATATHTVELRNPLDLGSTGRTITVGNGAAAIDAKISGNISGSGLLTVNGNTAGTLHLTGSNSSNGLSISAAQVIVDSASALGPDTGTVTLSGQGGLASPTLLTVANPVTMSTSGAKLGNAAATGDIVLAGPLQLSLNAGSLNAPSLVNLVGLSKVDIRGQISGTGATNYVGFVVPAGKTLRFGADNSAWEQNVTLRDAGTVVIGDANALGSGMLSFGDNNNSSAIVLTSEVDLTDDDKLTQLVYLHRIGENMVTFSGTNSIELGGGVQWNSQNRGFTNDISGGSLIVSGTMTLGAGANNYISSSGTTSITGDIVGSSAGLLLNSPTVLSGASGTSKTGLITFAGTNSYTGSTTLYAGTLKLNYDTGTGGTNTSKLSNTASIGTLLLNGGTLELSGGSHLETVLSTTLNTGGTFVKQTNSGSSTLDMGAITFTGGAIDFSADSIATTTTGVTNGILSQRATVAGSNFAMKSGSNIVAYDYLTNGVTGYTGTAMSANTNYAMQTAGGANTLAGTTGDTSNTLKIANTATGSLSVGTNTLTVGAILFSGSANYDITTSGSGKVTPSILHNYGTGGAVLNLGALGGALTQFGTGTTVLTSAAQANAGVTVNGGTVQFSTNAQIGTPSNGAGITLNNGTLLASETVTLDNAGSNKRNITLNAGGGTLAAASGKTLTVSGVISGTSLTIGGPSTNGTVELTGINTYTGATTVNGGTLAVTGTGSINTSGAITVNAGGTLRYSSSSTALTKAPVLASTGPGVGQRATLGGTGTINAAVTLDSLGDVLSPGNSPGTLPFDTSQTWTSYTYEWEINDWVGVDAGSDFDQITIAGTLLLDGNSYALDILSLDAFDVAGDVYNFAETSNSWTILTTTGGIIGFVAGEWALNPAGFTNAEAGTWSLALANGNLDLVLNYTAIPEPSTAILAGLGLLGLCLRRRRRQ